MKLSRICTGEYKVELSRDINIDELVKYLLEKGLELDEETPFYKKLIGKIEVLILSDGEIIAKGKEEEISEIFQDLE